MRLYCEVGCDFNELITQQFKLEDIKNIQKVLTCKLHKGTPQTTPIKKVQKKVLQEMPDVTFYWAGDGPYREKITDELE